MVRDFDRSSGDRVVQQIDKVTGLPLWVVEVIDADEAARQRTVKVKVAATVQPVLPSPAPGSPFTAVELVNAGCWLQALMALLGHVSAEMSLRYGRLFDATVRNEYQRALTLAKAQLGPVLPGDRTHLPLAAVTGGNWRDAPLTKARLAGGYCLCTAAQGSCAYARRHHPVRPVRPDRPAAPQPLSRRRQRPPPRRNHPPPRTRPPQTRVTPGLPAAGYPQDEPRLAG